jgi:hypothetical protein
MTTSFNLEQAFEIGQIQIFQNIENIPDIEINLEKLFDGTAPMFLQATNGAPNGTLAGRSNARCSFAMDIYADTQTSASGVPISEVIVSGAYPNSTAFSFPVQGNFSETLSLIANNKVWTTGVGSFVNANTFPGNEVPLAIGASGGINRRQHLVYAIPATITTLDANNQVAVTFAKPATILPPDIDGITASGTNLVNSAGFYNAHIQSISVSTDLGRTPIYQLGNKSPYVRYVQFPVQVRSEIETIGTQWDKISATEAGVQTYGNNLLPRTIKIASQEGTYIDLGTQNKLQSVTMGGGDTGGGNVTFKYSYITFNDYTVLHPQDPGGLTS